MTRLSDKLKELPKDAISPAHDDKPDPEEPWRYECLDCGSRDVVKRKKGKRFYCRSCNDRKKSMLDLKTGMVVEDFK